jgi:hypothetical protein
MDLEGARLASRAVGLNEALYLLSPAFDLFDFPLKESITVWQKTAQDNPKALLPEPIKLPEVVEKRVANKIAEYRKGVTAIFELTIKPKPEPAPAPVTTPVPEEIIPTDETELTPEAEGSESV